MTFNSDITYSTVTYYRKNSATSTKTSAKTTDRAKDTIIRTIRSTPSITIKELSLICNLSVAGVRYNIDQLKNDGIIRRVGSKGGYWEILK